MSRRLRALPFLVLPFVLALATVSRAEEGWEAARDAFRRAQKAEGWKERSDGFLEIASHDGADTVAEILRALAREDHPAVILAGVETLGLLRSIEARDALLAAARGSGPERPLVLVALESHPGPEVTTALLEVAGGRDAMAAAQAALSLRPRPVPEAVPVLTRLLAHADWQVVAAAARTLGAWKEPAALAPLVAALEKAEGRVRTDLLDALAQVTGASFGDDLDAWRRLAAGEDADAIEAHPTPPPTAFGVPIRGQRLVVVLDWSLRMGDAHPFSRERLQALSAPPDGNPIPWFRTATNGQFARGQLDHLLDGLPKGTKVEFVVFNREVQPMFGRLTTLNAAARRKAEEALDALVPDDGIASWPALLAGLDAGGAKDAAAWRSGPDEILFVTVNMPNAGEVREADVLAGAVGLKARLRMVPIHAVGIHYHPYEMCRALAERTGGLYVSLVE